MKKPVPAETKTMAVEIDGALRRRLRIYIAAHDELTIKAVVNAALDEYLRKRSA